MNSDVLPISIGIYMLLTVFCSLFCIDLVEDTFRAFTYFEDIKIKNIVHLIIFLPMYVGVFILLSLLILIKWIYDKFLKNIMEIKIK